jgi:hypothetical protein
MHTIPASNGTQTVEVWPAHCRNGHRLGPGKVTGYYQVARGRIIRA